MWEGCRWRGQSGVQRWRAEEQLHVDAVLLEEEKNGRWQRIVGDIQTTPQPQRRQIRVVG